jgi:site-specific DNA recombinase
MIRRAPSAEPAARTSFRCAIYTRKSTEEGLDQEFNSLDAQREACAAYILSQRHEGWMLVPDLYDDGGYSGGNMQRPGLVQLLAEVKAGKVDVIVVYKVDRLTRALSDFAKIVDVLDAAGASFVSITQAFNTTTSMGRLTLNVLLSFAQFEREVISERVRDKIAASKRKGMWMGGPVPLGYNVKDRKLLINQAEAETVLFIMRRYLEIGSVPDLVEGLDREGIRSKVQHWSNGRTRGGQPFARGAIYCLLSNRLYRGEIVHRGSVYPGEHEAIVPEELWDAVQAKLRSGRADRRSGRNARDPSLLAGMVRDDQGRRMTPSHARKGALRYRYYVSVDDAEGRARPGRPAIRLAASDLEQVVAKGISSMLADRPMLIERLAPYYQDTADFAHLVDRAGDVLMSLASLQPSAVRQVYQDVDLQLVISNDQVAATVSLDRLASLLGAGRGAVHHNATRCEVPLGSTIIRRGHELRLIVSEADDTAGKRDGRLIALLLRAREARQQLLEPATDRRSALPEYSEKHLARLARLSFLAPDIVASILDGKQPERLNARQLLRAAEIPLAWHDQRRMFGYA